MKRILLALLAWLAISPAYAGVSCSVPFQLQNATTADATQVMANYNALIACLANAAAAGANNDITSLSALSTPITPAQGGTSVFTGGTSTGSGNIQVVASVTPTTFFLTAGRQVTYIAGFSNSGPTTLNVASSGATNVFRRTQLGISAMVGGEIVAGQTVTVLYDGTQFQLLSGGPYLVGEIRDFAGVTGVVPTGWAFIDGSCQLRAGVFADLFSVVSTVYDPTGSTCDVAHFALPDGRGRVLAGQDTMGVNGAANRITSAGSSCSGGSLGGAGCGTQSAAFAQNQLPNVTVGVNITDPGHTHGYITPGAVAPNNIVNGTGANQGSTNGVTNSAVTGITAATASINGNVTQQNLVRLPPLQIVTKIVKL